MGFLHFTLYQFMEKYYIRRAAKKVIFVVAWPLGGSIIGAKQVCHCGKEEFYFDIRTKVPITSYNQSNISKFANAL